MSRALIVHSGGTNQVRNAITHAFQSYLPQVGYEDIFISKKGSDGLLSGQFAHISQEVIDPRSGRCTYGTSRTPVILPTLNSPIMRVEGNELTLSSEENGKRGTENVQRISLAEENLKDWGIDAVIFVGGVGTARYVHELRQQSNFFQNKSYFLLCAMDNDGGSGATSLDIDNVMIGGELIPSKRINVPLCITYSSVVRRGRDLVSQLYSQYADDGRIFVVETFGRMSGMVAGGIAALSNAQLTAIPEYALDEENLGKFAERARGLQGKTGWTLIVASEGAVVYLDPKIREKQDSNKVGVIRDLASGTRRLGGISKYLVDFIGKEEGVSTGHQALAYLIRAGTPTPFDLKLIDILTCDTVDTIRSNSPGLVSEIDRVVSYDKLHTVEVKRRELTNCLNEMACPGDFYEPKKFNVHEFFRTYIRTIQSEPKQDDKPYEMGSLKL